MGSRWGKKWILYNVEYRQRLLGAAFDVLAVFGTHAIVRAHSVIIRIFQQFSDVSPRPPASVGPRICVRNAEAVASSAYGRASSDGGSRHELVKRAPRSEHRLCPSPSAKAATDSAIHAAAPLPMPREPRIRSPEALEWFPPRGTPSIRTRSTPIETRLGGCEVNAYSTRGWRGQRRICSNGERDSAATTGRRAGTTRQAIPRDRRRPGS
jgi:hypothetical protein